MALTIDAANNEIRTDQSSLTKTVNTHTAETTDSAGRSYQAQKPQFMQHLSSEITSGNYWVASTVSAPDGTYNGDFAACYNSSNGRFTAPIAGMYQFGSHGIPTGATTDGRFAWYVNGGNVQRSIITTNGASHSGLVGQPMSVYLNAGDYVNYITTSGMTSHGGTWSGFSGCLIG